MEINLRYFSKKNKPEFNLILPKIRRYITTQDTLQTNQSTAVRDTIFLKVQTH